MRTIAVAISCCTSVTSACVNPKAKACEAAQHELAKLSESNERAFAKALEQKGLSPIKPVLRFEPDDAKLREVGSIFTVDDQGKTVRVVALDTYGGCEPTEYELVIDRSQRIWHVHRAPHTVTEHHVTICSCRPYNAGCGANPGLAQMLLELPPGASYGGDVTITFDAANVVEEFTNKQPDGTPCPPEQYRP